MLCVFERSRRRFAFSPIFSFRQICDSVQNGVNADRFYFLLKNLEFLKYHAKVF